MSAIVAKNVDNYNKIKRLKWFGIDRFKDNQNFLGERVRYKICFVQISYE